MRHKVSQEVKQNIVGKNVHFTLTFNLNISKLEVFYMTHRVIGGPPVMFRNVRWICVTVQIHFKEFYSFFFGSLRLFLAQINKKRKARLKDENWPVA